MSRVAKLPSVNALGGLWIGKGARRRIHRDGHRFSWWRRTARNACAQALCPFTPIVKVLAFEQGVLRSS